MSNELQGKRVAILATNGFEQSELAEPRQALLDAGARVEVVSPAKDGRIRGWKHTDWGESVAVDVPLDAADPSIYDALVLPGGVMNPDKLRLEAKAIDFVRHFVESAKPIAAICHGPWT
ncbi:MAG TPA: DJ-1/PfpI family protein, partial [Planctomycetota bacterium]|nr:DJ-1/PfpI family protein [Planctomycetota bacterium]